MMDQNNNQNFIQQMKLKKKKLKTYYHNMNQNLKKNHLKMKLILK